MDAVGLGAYSEQDAATSVFDGSRQRAIVDQLAADAGNTADALEHSAPDQLATACGSGRPHARVADPCGRVQQQEEKHEGGNQSALGQ